MAWIVFDSESFKPYVLCVIHSHFHLHLRCRYFEFDERFQTFALESTGGKQFVRVDAALNCAVAKSIGIAK